MEIRNAREAELDHLAALWHDGWQDAHARILPAELARHRTLESFRQRLQAALDEVRVAGAPGQPLGFCITRGDELYQLYVSADARGSGIAAALLADAEERLGARGVTTAWLACAIGNARAARFYEKQGWHRMGTMTSQLPTPDGPFPLEVWRYEKPLCAASRPAVGVAHVVMETDRMEATARLMRIIGMRPIFDGPEVSVYELRGGTHLILMRKDTVAPGDAAFDLMVDDLHTTHARFTSEGLKPSPIEARPAIDHEVFTVREPAGHLITFFSSHTSGKPV
ncbi:GNAT family N-acetyltransferase [Marilutibacter alkalisoli]|uniref:GNAT family N-acetyltransferase n=1 Tax=Marilutibacter alkalisoli TaxID=2591633 RepID=A0A514BTI6_9GAMM|nr:GNAT family N-acetyltransferase [Lysobacter alkalisoli]QDH70718.1 GNAT family N-acetyltransferase [Lysobacter alkalisoli]